MGLEVTEEMIQAYVDASDGWLDPDEQAETRIAAVLTLAEPRLREQLSDALDAHASKLRGPPFRRGDVGIEYISGIEEAAAMVRNGRIPDGDG